jgi:hypothetical protein
MSAAKRYYLIADTVSARNDIQVIRMAPVPCFGLDGYLAMHFFNDTLVGLTWVRDDMSTYSWSSEWNGVFAWSNDVTPDSYSSIRRRLLTQFGTPDIDGETRSLRDAARSGPMMTRWHVKGETINLNYQEGGITYTRFKAKFTTD